MERGYFLFSQQVRDLIINGEIKIQGQKFPVLGDDGRFKDAKLEGRIQPTSFDVALMDEGFVLDTEELKGFRPQEGKQVYRSILELPKRHRRKVDISEGLEVKGGFTYLFPLDVRRGEHDIVLK